MYFPYGETEIAYLKGRDKRLGKAIDQIGPVYRETEGDLFTSVVHQIVGQQISSAALRTIWARLVEKAGTVTPEALCRCGREELQSCGISFRKAEYILAFARRVETGELDLEALARLPDQEVIRILSALPGIGVWTAQMLLIFCLQRPDVVSFGDLGIRRGMRMLYRHREIDRERFARYAKRYSPYGTVASLYLWAIAGGAIPGLTDPAARPPKSKGKQTGE